MHFLTRWTKSGVSESQTRLSEPQGATFHVGHELFQIVSASLSFVFFCVFFTRHVKLGFDSLWFFFSSSQPALTHVQQPMEEISLAKF